MNFCFFALGCKVNLFESEALSKLAEQNGHKIVDKMADIFKAKYENKDKESK